MKCDCGAEMQFKKGTKNGKAWAGNFCPACKNVKWENLTPKAVTPAATPITSSGLSPDEIALRLVEGLIKVKFYDFADRNETKEAIYNDFILFRNRL